MTLSSFQLSIPTEKDVIKHLLIFILNENILRNFNHSPTTCLPWIRDHPYKINIAVKDPIIFLIFIVIKVKLLLDE
jgi:hypothetical protein